MNRDGNDDRRKNHPADTALDAPVAADLLPDATLLEDVSAELAGMVEGVRPDPEDIEDALSAAEVPALADADVDATVLPEAVSVDPADADAVVEAGEGVAEFAVETSGEAATVVVEAGGEAVEVAVEDGGEMAAEAAVEVLAAALDGL